MKIQAEDAVARAMDWLAQLREEEASDARRDAGDEPAAATAPPAPVPPVPVPRAGMPRAGVPRAEPLASAPSPPEPLTADPPAGAPPSPASRSADPPASEPLSPAPLSADPLTSEALFSAPLSADPLAGAPPPGPLTAEPLAPLPPVPAQRTDVPRAALPPASEPLPPGPLAAELPRRKPRAAQPTAPLPRGPIPPDDPPHPGPRASEPLSPEPLTGEAPLPVSRAEEPPAAPPPVPVPSADDLPPVTAWATTAWATAAAAAAGSPAEVPPAGRPGRQARLRPRIEITERAAIGDELRIPIAWCEMGSCISHHEDPVALGEADIRDRAVAAGWRLDALGRLACPKCLQSDSWFWTAHPVTPWDRDTAVARTTLMAAVAREYATAAGAEGRAMGVSPYSRPAIAPLPIRSRYPEHPGRPGRGMGEASSGSRHAV